MSDISNRRRFTFGVGLTLFILLMIVSFWYLFKNPQNTVKQPSIKQQKNQTTEIETPSNDSFNNTESSDTTQGTILVPFETDNEDVKSITELIDTEYYPFAKTENWDKALKEIENLTADDVSKQSLKGKLAEKYRNYELSKIDEISRRDGKNLALNYIDGELIYGEKNQKISTKWYFDDYPEEIKKFDKFKEKIKSLEVKNTADSRTALNPNKVETANVASEFVSSTEPTTDENGNMYLYPQFIVNIEEFLIDVLKASYNRHNYHSVYQKIHDEYEWANSKDAEKLEEFQLALLNKQIQYLKDKAIQKTNLETIKSDSDLNSAEKSKFLFYGLNDNKEKGIICQINDVENQIYSLLTETNKNLFDEEIISIRKNYKDYISSKTVTLFIKLPENLSTNAIVNRLGCNEVSISKWNGNTWDSPSNGNSSFQKGDILKVEVIKIKTEAELCN